MSPSATKIVSRLASKIVTQTIRNSRPGIAMKISVMRMMTSSTQPPYQPEIAPSVMPMLSATPWPTNPITSEMRAPYSKRLKMSRPISSLPSKNSAPGGSKRAV